MPQFRVEALEKYIARTLYVVPARSRAEAERLCRAGQIAYERLQIEEGDEEWLETVSVSSEGLRLHQIFQHRRNP